jgi:crotonobetainyl-CoA:carnitine CoA-transferase CaiB-like acyl-CoA transferase
MSIENLVTEKFGPLQGVKILSTGTLIAQPFAAELAAEMGAEVIQVERPGIGDVGWRNIGIRLATKDGKSAVATTWIQERRNVFCVSLDLSTPRGREIFLKLIARADIWMESSKPGTCQKWQFDDAEIWKINPKLVITHVSGFGQTGDPDYVHRASYDVVGQAVGGMMYQTGFPDPTPPTRAAPWTGDYLTALFTMWSSLAGLTYARATGRGQSIDVAQYEAVHKTMGGTMVEYFQNGVVRERSGNRAQGFQPLDTFQAIDGWVVMGAIGDVYSRLLRVIGLDPADPKWETARTQLESIEGIEFDAILRGWVSERTVNDVVTAMAAGNVPCSPIMTSKDIAEDPQYRARGMHVEWEDEQVGTVKGIGVAPKFSLTPGKIVRGSVPIGHDNDRVFRELLGVSASELESLRRDKVI